MCVLLGVGVGRGGLGDFPPRGPLPLQLQSLVSVLRQCWGSSCAFSSNPILATTHEGGNMAALSHTHSALSHGSPWKGVCSCSPSHPFFCGQDNGGISISHPSSQIPSEFQILELCKVFSPDSFLYPVLFPRIGSCHREGNPSE